MPNEKSSDQVERLLPRVTPVVKEVMSLVYQRLKGEESADGLFIVLTTYVSCINLTLRDLFEGDDDARRHFIKHVIKMLKSAEMPVDYDDD